MQVKTKNLVVGVLIAAFVGLLWYQFVYSPLETKASKARTAAREADNTAATLRHQLADAATAKRNAKTHDPSLSVMNEAVPADAAEASFLRSIDALRVTSGADWQSITPTVPAPTGTSSSINVGITVQGTQDQLLRYIDRPRGAQAHLRHRQPLADGRNLELVGVVLGSECGPGAPADADLGSYLQPARRGRGDDGHRGHRNGYGHGTRERSRRRRPAPRRRPGRRTTDDRG